jgi:plastocyanin
MPLATTTEGPDMRVVPPLLAALLLLSGAAQAGVIRGVVEMPKRAADASVLDAVVYIDSLPPPLAKKWERRRSKASVVQRNRRFTPRVTAVTAGTTVAFLNRDDVYHNVFSVSPVKRFDLGKYPPRAINQVTFNRPGVVNLFCDIHPGMAAYVLVLPHRLFVRPTADGAFELPPLPYGVYDLIAWHPSCGRVVRRVTVDVRGTVDVAMRF